MKKNQFIKACVFCRYYGEDANELVPQKAMSGNPGEPAPAYDRDVCCHTHTKQEPFDVCDGFVWDEQMWDMVQEAEYKQIKRYMK